MNAHLKRLLTSFKRLTWTPRHTVILISVVAAFILAALVYSFIFGPIDRRARTTEFMVEPGTTVEGVITQLSEEDYIRSPWAFRIAFLRATDGRGIRPGAYKISQAMDTWMIARTLVAPPYLSYVTLPPGLRKEQVAAILADTLGWTEAEKIKWITTDTEIAPSVSEGVYFPDTYLIPSDQEPADIAARMRGRFQDVFAPYAEEAARQGISWTDVVIMASLVEREAAKNDKALVAGILWNRIEADMPLAVDASLQYIRGTEKNGWWPVPKSEDKFLESPFNTYQHAGLPPHAIANPSLASIEAVLYPEETSCFFYLHDSRGRIHCSPSYRGHLSNIDRYLR